METKDDSAKEANNQAASASSLRVRGTRVTSNWRVQQQLAKLVPVDKVDAGGMRIALSVRISAAVRRLPPNDEL